MSETRAAAPGVPPGAAQGGLGPRGGGDLLGGPQPRRGEGQPATREGRAAAPPPGAPESGRGREKKDPPLVEGPPSKEGGCSAKGVAGREREQWRRTPGPWEHSAGRLHAGERPALEPLAQRWGKREPGRRGCERCCGRNRERKTRRAKGPTAKAAWEWICSHYACGALCRWGQPWCSRGTA